MAERTPSDLSPPMGEPEYAWFAGAIEGARHGDDGAIHDAASAIERLGIGRADLAIEGARFTLLLSGEPVPGERLDEGTKRSFIGALDALVRASRGAALQSSLCCTEVHRDRVVETLFGVEEGRLRPLSRVREVDARDRRRAARAPDAPSELRAPRHRRALVAAAVLAVFGGFAIWQSGFLDTLTTADPVGLPIRTTEFGDRLRLEVERVLGGYRVEIRRGPTFPDSDEKLAIWEDRLAGPRDRIAHRSLAGEGTAFVHLLGEESRRLATVQIDLRPLIHAGRPIIAELPGDPRTSGFAISPVDAWGR